MLGTLAWTVGLPGKRQPVPIPTPSPAALGGGVSPVPCDSCELCHKSLVADDGLGLDVAK